MPTNDPRLRGSPSQQELSVWQLGDIPQRVVLEVGKLLVHRRAIGYSDISGNDFGTIFASAIGGVHLSSSNGLVDVVLDRTGWTVKTIKNERPFEADAVRLISGRNSPVYSFGITDPHADAEETGGAIVSIWNKRMKLSFKDCDELRGIVLIRNADTNAYCLFEHPTSTYVAADYAWEFNKNRNLIAHEISSSKHHFTWQPHGAQFTIIRYVPGSARRFHIRSDIPVLTPQSVLSSVEYDDSWIRIRS